MFLILFQLPQLGNMWLENELRIEKACDRSFRWGKTCIQATRGGGRGAICIHQILFFILTRGVMFSPLIQCAATFVDRCRTQVDSIMGLSVVLSTAMMKYVTQVRGGGITLRCAQV